MSDPTDSDMDQPITKREALDLFITKREFHDVMKSLFDYLDKKFDAIDSKFDAIDKKFVTSETNLKTWFSQELGSHTGTIYERHRDELSTIDDKYKDLPERVTKLEAKVFAPKRQRRR